jgi:hypothetical protein
MAWWWWVWVGCTPAPALHSIDPYATTVLSTPVRSDYRRDSQLWGVCYSVSMISAVVSLARARKRPAARPKSRRLIVSPSHVSSLRTEQPRTTFHFFPPSHFDGKASCSTSIAWHLTWLAFSNQNPGLDMACPRALRAAEAGRQAGSQPRIH